MYSSSQRVRELGSEESFDSDGEQAMLHRVGDLGWRLRNLFALAFALRVA